MGLDKNTIVVLTGDNGGVVSGDSYSSCMFPYRGGKGRQWEGGLRVPYYIKAPGVTQPGSTCTVPVIHLDFYPTLLALAGIREAPPQAMDGVSLLPLLKGGTIGDRPLLALSSLWQPGRRTLVHHPQGRLETHPLLEDNRNELYHLPGDIGERHDLASQKTQRTARLWAELQTWLKQTGGKIPQPYAGYNPSNAARARKPRTGRRNSKSSTPAS